MNINVGIDLPIGIGPHKQRVEFLYQATTPLLTYLNPWGGEYVLVIQNRHILGVVRRDKRPMWQKPRGCSSFYREILSAEMTSAAKMSSDTPLANCYAESSSLVKHEGSFGIFDTQALEVAVSSLG
jgi:hypothetical protein